MEQIVSRGGVYYYGGESCADADDAYRKFRKDLHDSLGKEVFKRLDRIGRRRERVHGYGFFFDGGAPHSEEFAWMGRVPYRILGLVQTSYCRMIGMWDVPDMPDDKYERWLEWAFSYGTKCLRRVGTDEKVGRTGKLLNRRYR